VYRKNCFYAIFFLAKQQKLKKRLMMARRAAATTMTHFAHIIGPQTRATTTMTTASKKRHKHNFMISFSFSKRCSLSYRKKYQSSSLKNHQGEKSKLCAGILTFVN